MFHIRVSALEFLAATISISCALVQRPATSDSHMLFSKGVYSQFSFDLSRHFRRLVEGVGGVEMPGWYLSYGIRAKLATIAHFGPYKNLF